MFLAFTIEDLTNLLSAGVSLVGLVFVGLQLRDGNHQRKLESQMHLYDLNRELISLGFANPQLFDVLTDAEHVDPVLRQRYLQLWLNLYALAYTFKRSGVFKTEVFESFDVDFRDTMTMSSMRRHWQRYGKFYPASFQESVNDILDEAGFDLTEADASTK